ncbi:MAG: homoserine dehydrogenase [Kiloniellales bacterium]
MSRPFKVAVAGLGTVGVGTLRLLAAQAEALERRCGRRIEVTAVSARDRRRDRGIDISDLRWYDDPVALAREAEAEVVVEMIGGSDGPACAVVEAAIAAGRHVVTANKALMAVHGTALARSAEAAGVRIGFEASVAGGIPIVKALREGLAGNRIGRVYGILNGTCNHILTTMRDKGAEFADVLEEAQKLGYAEADPSFDIDGVDTAHKLAILTGLAFGSEVNLAGVHVEGVRPISLSDIEYAREFDYEIKLLGLARMTEHGVEQRVHPCMVPRKAPIADVDGVFNAVVAEGDFVGTVMLEGRGAGAGPTASAVVADLLDIARGGPGPIFAVPAESLKPVPASPMMRHIGRYYLRLMVIDQPGVMAEVSAILRDNRISIESMLQRGRDPEEVVAVVLTTHETEERAMVEALGAIEALDTVREKPCMIRIEEL